MAWVKSLGKAVLVASALADDIGSDEPLQCFGDGDFSFDLCCDTETHGEEGDPSCWDETYSFEACCVPHINRAFANSKCWAGPAARIQANRQRQAYDYLQDEASMEEFCCGLMHNTLCWGDREDMLLDSQDGQSIGFTATYVRCCFRKLQDMIAADSPPAWMASGVSQDLAPFRNRKARLRKADLDAFEAALPPSNPPKFCRFRVSPGQSIEHCDFALYRYDELLQQVRNSLYVLQRLVPSLPVLDFFVNVAEAACIEDQRKTASPITDAFPVPVLVQAKPRKGCHGSVLMPWWAFLNMDWARRYPSSVQREGSKIPWRKRVARLFWRGSDTGCLLPGRCGLLSSRRPSTRSSALHQPNINRTCTCEQWNLSTWHLFPRSRLVLLSSLYGAVDAKFTKDIVNQEVAQAYKDAGLHVDEIVPPKEHLWYRFLMYLDGVSFSDRLCWLLHSGAAIFRADSNLKVWLDRGLKPRVHFVPVKQDLRDLVDVVQWAQEHDLETEGIAVAAQRFAQSELSLDASIFYLYHVLCSYTRLFE